MDFLVSIFIASCDESTIRSLITNVKQFAYKTRIQLKFYELKLLIYMPSLTLHDNQKKAKQLAVASGLKHSSRQGEVNARLWGPRAPTCVHSACGVQTWHSLLLKRKGCDPSQFQHSRLDGNECLFDEQWYSQVSLSAQQKEWSRSVEVKVQ